MPDFCIQYYLNLAQIRANGHSYQSVYEFIGTYLRNANCQSYQQSCWRIDNAPGGPAFHAAMLLFAATVEGSFGFGVFRHLQYEQRFNFVAIR